MSPLADDMGNEDGIMPPGHLVVPRMLASGNEVVSLRAANEGAFLQSLGQATWGSTLLVDAILVDLALCILLMASKTSISKPSKHWEGRPLT